MLDLIITNEQKIKVTLTPKTIAGKDAAVDGKPVWTVQSGSGTVEPSEDGLSAYLISSDTIGDTMVLVEADADLGEGVETISGQIQLHVEGAQAANLGLSAGPAEPK